MKHSKIFRTLVSTIILCLLLLAVPATPALAQPITVSPTSGTVGTTVTVTGYGFTGVPYVYIFFGYYATYPVKSSTVIGGQFSTTFVVPNTATPGIHPVTVQDTATYGAATVATTGYFTVTQVQLTISPLSGYVGDHITISGTGFAANSPITFFWDNVIVSGTTTTTTTAGSFTTTTFTIPPTSRGSHTIKAQDASNNSATATFTVLPKITVTPISGGVSDAVSISGTGFTANSPITFFWDNVIVSGATTTATTAGSFTTTTFTIPPTSRGSHTIKAQDASGNNATTPFTIAEIITITPTSGTSDTIVTINGTGFSASRPITITYDAVPVTTNPAVIYTDVNGSFTTSFNVPTGGAARTYSVAATDGIYSASASFVAMTDATISQTTTEASPGYAGMELTITGTGFKPNATVTITYTSEPVVLKTVPTDVSGAFSSTVTIPASVSGSHTITVTDGYTSKQFDFVMESQTPPVPAPLLPEEGIKTKARVHFDWEDVTDDSLPVTYTLQIASDTDFTTMVLEKAVLTTSEYTLTKEEELESVSKEEPYYWRVKAIDGAFNESESEARSFSTGFQWPDFVGWPLYLVIGVGGLLLLILGFWLGRRTAYY